MQFTQVGGYDGQSDLSVEQEILNNARIHQVQGYSMVFVTAPDRQKGVEQAKKLLAAYKQDRSITNGMVLGDKGTAQAWGEDGLYPVHMTNEAIVTIGESKEKYGRFTPSDFGVLGKDELYLYNADGASAEESASDEDDEEWEDDDYGVNLPPFGFVAQDLSSEVLVFDTFSSSVPVREVLNVHMLLNPLKEEDTDFWTTSDHAIKMIIVICGSDEFNEGLEGEDSSEGFDFLGLQEDEWGCASMSTVTDWVDVTDTGYISHSQLLDYPNHVFIDWLKLDEGVRNENIVFKDHETNSSLRVYVDKLSDAKSVEYQKIVLYDEEKYSRMAYPTMQGYGDQYVFSDILSHLRSTPNHLPIIYVASNNVEKVRGVAKKFSDWLSATGEFPSTVFVLEEPGVLNGSVDVSEELAKLVGTAVVWVVGPALQVLNYSKAVGVHDILKGRHKVTVSYTESMSLVELYA